MADTANPDTTDQPPLGKGPVGPPHPHIIATEVKGDLSLYDPKQERVLVLNGTASDIWLLCDGEQSVDGIVGLLAAAYGQPETIIRDDVVATVTQFVEEEFIPAP